MCKCHSQMFYVEKYLPLDRACLTYVRPLLKYNSVIWSSHPKYGIDAVEKVQRRSTKRIPGLGNYSYIHRLTNLCLPRLKSRRLQSDLIWCDKIRFGSVKSVRKISSNFDTW